MVIESGVLTGVSKGERISRNVLVFIPQNGVGSNPFCYSVEIWTPYFWHKKMNPNFNLFTGSVGFILAEAKGFEPLWACTQTVFKSLKAFGIPYSAMLWNGIFFQKNERWTAYLLDFICFSLLYVFLQCFLYFLFFAFFEPLFVEFL